MQIQRCTAISRDELRGRLSAHSAEPTLSVKELGQM